MNLRKISENITVLLFGVIKFILFLSSYVYIIIAIVEKQLNYFYWSQSAKNTFLFFILLFFILFGFIIYFLYGEENNNSK